MRRIVIWTLTLLPVSLLLVSQLPIRAAAQQTGFCRAYATNAVNQQRANLAGRCGYGGLMWHLSYPNHYAWCMRHSREAAVRTNNYRSRLLWRCRQRRR